MYPKSQNKLPRDIEKLNKKKRLRRLRRRTLSKLLNKDQASSEDKSNRRVTRATSFLLEPPSFDITVLKLACVD